MAMADRTTATGIGFTVVGAMAMAAASVAVPALGGVTATAEAMVVEATATGMGAAASTEPKLQRIKTVEGPLQFLEAGRPCEWGKEHRDADHKDRLSPEWRLRDVAKRATGRAAAVER